MVHGLKARLLALGTSGLFIYAKPTFYLVVTGVWEGGRGLSQTCSRNARVHETRPLFIHSTLKNNLVLPNQ